MFLHTIDSPLGPLQLLATDAGLAAIHLPNGAPLDGERCETPLLAAAAAQLREYFAGTRTVFDLPLDAATGTEFQRRVWQVLVTIPFGETWSYGKLARAIGQPTASRAVGAANGANPLAIVVPCHRVIGANGTLTGYAGGMAAKQWLLAHEQRQAQLPLCEFR
jgi:methylated-DNA-[protein]-cysteine S-methyltransferase